MSNVQDPNDTGSNQEQETTDQPSYVTKSEFDRVLNSAITNHMKRLNVSKQITDALEQSLTPFKDLLAARTATEPAAAQVADKGPSAQSPELIAMQRKLETMERSMKEKELLIASRERASREKEAFSKVTSELTALGVRPEGVDHLAKVLRADNKIQVDDDGLVNFVVDEDNVMDLKDGLKTYLDPKVNPAAGLYLLPKTQVGKGKVPAVQRASGSRQDISSIQDPAQRVLAQLSMMKNK